MVAHLQGGQMNGNDSLESPIHHSHIYELHEIL